jgi:hypothetical protein
MDLRNCITIIISVACLFAASSAERNDDTSGGKSSFNAANPKLTSGAPTVRAIPRRSLEVDLVNR